MQGEVPEHDVFDAVRQPADPLLESVLTADAPGARRERAAVERLASLARTHLRRGAGFFVLTGLPADAAVGGRAVVRAASMLGSLLPQDKEGTLVRGVRYAGTSIGQGRRSRYADSNMGGHLHTDGAEMGLPLPDIFMLFCVRQSAAGGAFQVLHVRDLRRALSRRPDALRVLSQPFHFDRRGDQHAGERPTVVKPVLFEHDGRPAITYLRKYIEIGHDYPSSLGLSQQQREALDDVDEACSDRRLVREGKLCPGELAFFDNLSLLHGRTEFQDDPDPTRARLLLRAWVQTAGRPTRSENTR
jgi:hypothetical protein